MHTLPQDIIGHIGTYLPLHECYPWLTTCVELYNSFTHCIECKQRQWASLALYAAERQCIERGEWKSPVFRVFRYRHANWIHRLAHERRLPTSLAYTVFHYFKKVQEGGRAMQQLRHVCCDIFDCKAKLYPCTTVCIREMMKLPFGELKCGPYRIHSKNIFHGERVVASITPQGLYPTALFTHEVAAMVNAIERQPVDALLRYCTRCPFCGESKDIAPLYHCAMKWAEWGHWIPRVKEFGTCRWHERRYWLVNHKRRKLL